MPSRLLVLPALVAGALLVTACSGGSTDGSGSPSSLAATSGTATGSAGPSGSTGAPDDLCRVLTTDDIAQQVGGVVSAGSATAATLCTFTVHGSSKLGSAGAVTDDSAWHDAVVALAKTAAGRI